MKTQNIKVEFKTTRIFESYYQTLYVNDMKTNIYYPEKQSIYDPNAKEKALAEAKLIEEGLIYPINGIFENFDICASFYADLSNANKVDGIKEDYKNRILSRTGKDYSNTDIQAKKLEEIRNNKSEWTQWTKRINPNTYTLLSNIGVKFGNNGYHIFYY